MYKTALEYAKIVYENRPITIFFSRIPPICRRGCYSGFHPTIAVHIDDDGSIWKQCVAGFHCLPLNASQTYVGNQVFNLADLVKTLLKWKREYEPFSGYPDCGIQLVKFKDEFGDEHVDQQIIYFS
jgi:hypothetical protein